MNRCHVSESVTIVAGPLSTDGLVGTAANPGPLMQILKDWSIDDEDCHTGHDKRDADGINHLNDFLRGKIPVW
jgi:hypothetical protein